MSESNRQILEHARNNAILLSAYDSFYNCVVVDKQERIVFLSDHYAELLGMDKEQALGKLVQEVIPGTKMHEILETGRVDVGSLITLYDHQSKQNVTYICNRRPIFHNGEIIGAFAESIFTSFEDFQTLQKRVKQLQDTNRAYEKRLACLEQSKHPVHRIIGHSPAIREVKQAILDYAASNLAVLITGETGTGKEVFANAIHGASNRSMNPYIKINCAAIPKELMESELFGYEEGAFTGARKGGKPGKFLLADKGTILLDEIGELPLSVQAKLLRVLQEKEVEPVGATRLVPVNARLICCTNRDLGDMVEKGLFREDLYYRINIVELNIPPLRERMEDIKELTAFFIQKQNEENGYAVTEAAPEVLDLFQSYHWPGNVRELEHTIERACVLCKMGPLKREHLHFMEKKIGLVAEENGQQLMGLKGKKDQFERDAILKALIETRGNKTKAAKLLCIDRTVLYQKLKKYGIQ